MTQCLTITHFCLAMPHALFMLSDFNACTGEQKDFVPNIGLDRYIDLACDDMCLLPRRANSDKTVNTHGRKLLSLC